MKMYPQMFLSIYEEEENKRIEKLNRSLSIIQKIKLSILDIKIFYAMKNGETEVLVDFIEERLIVDLQQRGFIVGTKYLGCSALHMTMYFISWKKK